MRARNQNFFLTCFIALAAMQTVPPTSATAQDPPVTRLGLQLTVSPTSAGGAKSINTQAIRVNTKIDKEQIALRAFLSDVNLDGRTFILSAKLGSEAVLPDTTHTIANGKLDAEIRLKLKGDTDGSKQELVLTARTAATKELPELIYSGRVSIVIDTKGPEIYPDAIAERGASDLIGLWIKLKSDDFDPNSLERDDIIVSLGSDAANSLVHSSPNWNPASRTIQVDVQGMGVGAYEVRIRADTIQDDLGNKNKDELIASFKIDQGPTPPRKGLHVEFPEFLSRDTHGIREFNAFDRVTTRVVRLYYERDAYKVVKTINRNVEELNRSGASFAQDLANKLREQADDATTIRRTQEQEAIQEVQRAREARKGIERAEKQLQRNESALTELNAEKKVVDNSADGETPNALTLKIRAAEEVVDADERELKALKTSKEELKNATNPPATEPQKTANQKAIDETESKLQEHREERDELIARRSYEIERLTRQQELLDQTRIVQENVDAANNQINALNAQLADSQLKESQNTIGVLTAVETEDRAKARQFRQEVVAGLTDRDIYAAATMGSQDPVTQVSMSVIGEGAIHLRGPAKGINKIARMIHQMDTPVGQVKLGIQTVQINGEHGDRMEFVYERIDKHIAQARFLTHESTQLFRKAVQEVASEIALQVDANYVPPDMTEFDDECAALTGADLRHWRYVNSFFGGDFIQGLREMDSELLKHNNKLLSLHSMDTMSLAGALYVTAIAKHSVRQAIIERFKIMVLDELPAKEIDYYRALTRIRHGDPHINHLIVAHFGQRLDMKDAKMIWEKAIRTYQFSNFVGFFDAQLAGEDTLNNVQYATLRLAQALKAQLVSELELRNLVLERSLIEIRPDENLDRLISSKKKRDEDREIIEIDQAQLAEERNNVFNLIFNNLGRVLPDESRDDSFELKAYRRAIKGIQNDRAEIIDYVISEMQSAGVVSDQHAFASKIIEGINEKFVTPKLKPLGIVLTCPQIAIEHVTVNTTAVATICEQFNKINATVQKERALSRRVASFRRKVEADERDYEEAKTKNSAIRVLEAAIDETEEKAVELLEAMRSHVANVDNYLKRLAIALEDDFNAQFYNPAMMDVRRASRYWDVNLSQVENTTVLTNNRALAKVSPNATMEFDLPARDILLVEALKGSKALAQEYGNLLKDPTFIAGAELIGGRVPTGLGRTQSPVQGIVDPTLGLGQEPPEVGAALSQLIPQPAVYKFETGTALEIRPVIQPDGHSIVYRFDYLYTTNVREPVRADEKHLGRVKRHFTSTDVQTSSYEMREITRYSVALKASRTSRGVPLLEDVPAIGWIFRPMPNQESSLQQNIILGTSTIYPTLFDLMGLRWSPYADQIDSRDLAEKKKREREITRRYRSNLLNKARAFVREEIGGDLELPPDLPGEYQEPDPSPEQIPAGPIWNQSRDEEDSPVEEEISIDASPRTSSVTPRTRVSGRANTPRIASDPRESLRERSEPRSVAPRQPAVKGNPRPQRPAPTRPEPPPLKSPDTTRLQRPSLIQQASFSQPAKQEEAGLSSITEKTAIEPPLPLKEVPIMNVLPAQAKNDNKASMWQRLFKRGGKLK